MLIDGIHIPLTAPFTRDGGSYPHKLEYNVGRYSLTPASGLVALTSEMEGASLSDVEIAETLRLIGEVADPAKVLVAAVAKDSVRGALYVAETAAKEGFDLVLLAAPPQWESLSEQEVMLYFQAVADRAPLPIALSSGARRQGYRLSVDEIAELARHSNVLGIYDHGLTVERLHAISGATGGVRREVLVTSVFAPVTRRMQQRGVTDETGFVAAASIANAGPGAAPRMSAVKTRTKAVGFQVMSMGSSTGFADLLKSGVAGAMLSLAACSPQACYEAYAAFKDGDPALAEEKVQRLEEADAMADHLGIGGLKYGCDCNGYYGGEPRLPRLALNAEGRASVERALAGIRN
ncbi:MAG: dihydrodipicolinate synthase family protein [Acidobacteriota bacterium]